MTLFKQPTDGNIRKVLIVGAGAVGGYFGGRLCRSGSDVTFLVRPQAYEQISNKGLEIKSIDGDFLVHPPLIQKVSQIASVDLIILAVKCYDVAEVLKELKPLVEQGATILTLQNGISTEEEILAYYRRDCVVAGVAFITAKQVAAGFIEHSENGMISLGELSGAQSDRVAAMVELFLNNGISCYLKPNILQAKWEKLCWNATFNPLSVILDSPVSFVLDSDPLLERVGEAIGEVVAVAAAEGLSINPKVIENTLSATEPLRRFYTSMYEDFKKGKPTEIEYLNGEVIRRGEKHGIPTPMNKMLYALMKGLEMKRDL